MFRKGALALLLVLMPSAARAEWQLKPFGGITFGGTSPFADLDRVQGKPKLNLGLSALWLGEIVGIEGEVATTSGFFGGESGKVLQSHVATYGGDVVVAMPRRLSEYTLRPYFVSGLGGAHVSFSASDKSLVFSRTLPAWNIGGGVTGFVNDAVGLNWDVRLFRTLHAQRPDDPSGAVLEQQKLSFWRVSMGISIRL